MNRSVVFAQKYGFAAAAAAYSFTFGLASREHRALIPELCNRFGFNPGPKHPIAFPIVEPSLIVGDEEICLSELSPIDGNVSVLELVIIAKLVRKHRPRAMFEIGTFDGRTALNMALNSSEDARVYTLDLPEAQQASMGIVPSDVKYLNNGSSGVRCLGSSKVTRLYGDSATFDYSSYQGAIDMAFIDGAHSYEYVKSDTEAVLRMMRPGGFILWHDCTPHTSVAQALNELSRRSELKNMRLIEGTMLAYCAL